LLSPATAENATLAEYLKTDLQRIVESANDVQRVAPTIPRLHVLTGDVPTGNPAEIPPGLVPGTRRTTRLREPRIVN